MRRGFYLVLMVVLVLRGLMGSAMAAGMVMPLPTGHGVAHATAGEEAAHAPAAAAAAAHPTTQSGGEPTSEGANAGPGEPPSPGAGHHPGHESDHDHDHDHGMTSSDTTLASACQGPSGEVAVCSGTHHSSACSACDICHSAMLEAPTAAQPAPSPQRSAPPSACAQFDSAPAARAIKPPIA